jgi:hypothetical protein
MAPRFGAPFASFRDEASPDPLWRAAHGGPHCTNYSGELTCEVMIICKNAQTSFDVRAFDLVHLYEYFAAHTTPLSRRSAQ